MPSLSLYRNRRMTLYVLQHGACGVALSYRRKRWTVDDSDRCPANGGRSRDLLCWGHWLLVAFWPGRTTPDCAGPARELGSMASPGIDNDPRSGGPWAPLDGATAEALDRLRPGQSRAWWGGHVERTGPRAGTWSYGGLTHVLRREDHVWSLERLPSVAVIGVTP